MPFYFENKSQTNCTRNTVKYNAVQYSTAPYFCKAVSNAQVFVVNFQVYVNYFIIKCNYFCTREGYLAGQNASFSALMSLRTTNTF